MLGYLEERKASGQISCLFITGRIVIQINQAHSSAMGLESLNFLG